MSSNPDVIVHKCKSNIPVTPLISKIDFLTCSYEIFEGTPSINIFTTLFISDQVRGNINRDKPILVIGSTIYKFVDMIINAATMTAHDPYISFKTSR